MKPKVSILVPCYNVEKYLPQCLDSIVNQTLKDIEIILINDGSTDSTLAIIKKYAKGDKRIKIIDKENEGYGKSMNRGLDAATGEYIGIVESDDWVEPDAFEILYNTAKQNDADIAKGDFVFFDNDTGAESESWASGLSPELFDKVIEPVSDAPQIIWSGHPSIWTCIYRTKMIRDNKIYFAAIPGAAFQDMGFKPKTLLSAKRFIYVNKIMLHYRKHANNSDKQNNKVFTICDVHDDTDKWAQENLQNYGQYVTILNQSRLSNYIWNLQRLVGDAKKMFEKRFAHEFYDKIRAREVEYDYMNIREKVKLNRVVLHSVLWGCLYALNTMISPIYKVRIRNGVKIHYIFQKIPIIKKHINKRKDKNNAVK